MCGIFGIATDEVPMKVSDTLADALESMEYRGYDSVGMCILQNEGSMYLKAKGRVSYLREKIAENIKNSNKPEIKSDTPTIGVAHTRWATHGEASERNAHPVVSDKNGTFYVVHNGIISNYMELKLELLKEGYTFETDTDTEVICKLALQFYKSNKNLSLGEIARQTENMCEGAFSFILISPKHPGQMAAVRSGAPLILGVEENSTIKKINDKFFIKNQKSCCISSDVVALIQHTTKVINLLDGDIVEISGSEISITAIPGSLDKKIITASNDKSEALKGEHGHFMIKEIFEQKESMIRSMSGRVNFENKNIILDQLNCDKIFNAKRYIFVACGTSYHSCLANKKLFEEMTNVSVSVEIASNFMDQNPIIYKTDVIFFISQSGETADSISVLHYCKKAGATIVGITNVKTSTINSFSDCVLSINAGIEKAVASTKAYTSQFVCIVLVALYISQQKNTNLERRSEIIKELEKLQKYTFDTLNKSVDKFVEQLYKSENLILVSRGFQAATCLEGALKIKETTYIHAEGIFAGELKHGSLALVNENLNILLIIPNDKFYDKSHSAYQQIKARGATPMVICTEDIANLYENCISVPKTIDCLQGLLTVIPLQMISYKLAIKKGIDPDFPRNLAKSVTVE